MITIRAIGNDKNSSTKTLCDLYLERCRRKIKVLTKEFKGNTILEQQWLESNIPDQVFVITLDLNGKTLTSEQFAATIEQQLAFGKEIYFVIGGSEGVGDHLKSRSNLLLSFGKITLPHLLARVILCEQLYRAECISNNHPYHK